MTTIILIALTIGLIVAVLNLREKRIGGATLKPDAIVNLYYERPQLKEFFTQMSNGDPEAYKVLERLGILSLRYPHVDLNKFVELGITGQKITLIYRAVGRDIMKLAAATASREEMIRLLQHIKGFQDGSESVQINTITNQSTATNPTSITGKKQLRVGETTTLSALPLGGKWTSSNTVVATIGDTSGIVTGISAGTTRIRYWIGHTCVTAWIDVQ